MSRGCNVVWHVFSKKTIKPMGVEAEPEPRAAGLPRSLQAAGRNNQYPRHPQSIWVHDVGKGATAVGREARGRTPGTADFLLQRQHQFLLAIMWLLAVCFAAAIADASYWNVAGALCRPRRSNSLAVNYSVGSHSGKDELAAHKVISIGPSEDPGPGVFRTKATGEQSDAAGR